MTVEAWLFNDFSPLIETTTFSIIAGKKIIQKKTVEILRQNKDRKMNEIIQ